MSATTREIRDLAAQLVEQRDGLRLVSAVDLATASLGASVAEFQAACEELRSELDTDSLALWQRDRTTDEILNALSLKEQRVVVTKDTDFFHSHLLQGKPWKLLLVRTGNIRTGDLKALFERHLPEIIAALEQNSLVELDRQTVRVIV